MAILRNNTDRRQIFQLPHNVVCSDDKCWCLPLEQGHRMTNPETGEVRNQKDEVLVPNSVHLPARGTSVELPDQVVEVPQVAAAIRKGLITVDR